MLFLTCCCVGMKIKWFCLKNLSQNDGGWSLRSEAIVLGNKTQQEHAIPTRTRHTYCLKTSPKWMGWYFHHFSLLGGVLFCCGRPKGSALLPNSRRYDLLHTLTPRPARQALGRGRCPRRHRRPSCPRHNCPPSPGHRLVSLVNCIQRQFIRKSVLEVWIIKWQPIFGTWPCNKEETHGIFYWILWPIPHVSKCPLGLSRIKS